MNLPQLLRLLLVRFGSRLPAAAGWLLVAALVLFFLFSMMLWVLPVVLALGAGIFLGRQKDLGTTLLRWRAALSALRHSWTKRGNSAVQDVRWRDVVVVEKTVEAETQQQQ